MVGGPSKGLDRIAPFQSQPESRAGGATVISPALQRGVSVPTTTEPESQRDGAHDPVLPNIFAG
jgi:hypothetical protein